MIYRVKLGRKGDSDLVVEYLECCSGIDMTGFIGGLRHMQRQSLEVL